MSVSGSVLVDSNIVIAHLRGDPPLTARLQAADTVNLPWIVLGELYYGEYKSTQIDKIILRVHEFLSGSVLLLPDQSTIEHYGRIKADLARAGTPVPENDIWIAAIAKRFDLPVVTRDKHFSLIRGIALLAW